MFSFSFKSTIQLWDAPMLNNRSLCKENSINCLVNPKREDGLIKMQISHITRGSVKYMSNLNMTKYESHILLRLVLQWFKYENNYTWTKCVQLTMFRIPMNNYTRICFQVTISCAFSNEYSHFSSIFQECWWICSKRFPLINTTFRSASRF